MGWVEAFLKMPDEGEWVAMTLVREDGTYESRGYDEDPLRPAREAARWIAREIIANEMVGGEPLPLALRDEIAKVMVEDEFLGWPDEQTALVALGDWSWR